VEFGHFKCANGEKPNSPGQRPDEYTHLGSAKGAAIQKPSPKGWVIWQSKKCGLKVRDSRTGSDFLSIPTDCGLSARYNVAIFIRP
jgi:hypothetical protein